MNKCILEVINDEAEHPVEYAAPVENGKLSEAVQTALRELDLDKGPDSGADDEICRALRDGDVYWLEEAHCFCLVRLDV